MLSFCSRLIVCYRSPITREARRPASSLVETLRRSLAVSLAGLCLMFSFVLPGLAPAQADTPADGPVLYVFWSLECPVCLRQKPWFNGLEARFPGLQVVEMELSRSDSHRALFRDMAKVRGMSATYVPTLMLGSRAWVGDTPAQRAEIEIAIAAVLAGDVLLPDTSESLRLPLLGDLAHASTSVLGLTVLIAIVDGFNPCSLWVLTLLLARLIHDGVCEQLADVA